MTYLPDILSGEIGLVLGPQAERVTMLALTAVLALQQPVCILDGGNSFDAYHVARQLRRHTPDLEAALQRITVARAFTCYQVVSLLTATPASNAPYLVLDLLATFYDESVPTAESYRLLHLVIEQLHRLRQVAPVIVSLRPPPPRQPERAGLVAQLQAIATQTISQEVPLEPSLKKLF